MSKKGKSSNKYRKVVINNENIEKRNRFEKKKIFILIAFLLVLTLGSSYAVLTQVLTSNSKIVSIKSGVFKIDFEDGNKINLNNASPMTDEEGLNTDSYDFTISNTGNVDAKYTVLLEEKDNNTLDKKYIKYSIKKDNGSYSTPAYLSEGIVLERELGLRALESATYSLKIWLDNDADNSVQGKTFNARIVVNSVQDMSDLSDVESPIIKLNGDTELTLLKNTQFIDPGVLSVTDNKDNNLQVTKTYEYYNNGDTTSVEGVDTSVLGVYYIYYEAVDSEGNVGRSVRIINVVENEEKVPTITLLGDSNVYLKKGQDYIESGYTATDGEYDVTEKVVVEGKVNTNKAGVYTIKYLLELDNGETVSTTRTVTVEAVGVMTITNKTPVYSEKQAEVEITISSTEDNIEGYLVTNSNKQPDEADFVEIKNPSKTYTWKEEFNKNGTYYIWGLDSEKNVEELEITISNLDDTIPECTLDGEQTISIPNEEEITLTCTDSSGIEEKYLTDKHFEINDNIEITNISAPEAVTNGYKYTITLNGKTAGNSSISLKKGIISDIAGNKNNRTTKNITVELLEFTVTYNYSENGGTSSTKTSASVAYGSSIDLTPSATKSGWTFVGWNTNKDATTGLSTLKMSNSNVVLYAIYRKEAVTYTVTYTKGSNVDSIGKTTDSCTIAATYNGTAQESSCSITSPSITAATGYSAAGWYYNDEKVADATATYNLDNNITLIAKASSNTQTNQIQFWAWGFQNGEGTNSGGSAYKLGEDTFTNKTNDEFILDSSYAVDSPNGFSLSDTFGTADISENWETYALGTHITQKPKGMFFEYGYNPITYNITYNLDGGTNNNSNPSTYNVLYGVTLSNPTKTGYSFEGWYDSNNNKVTGINAGKDASFTSVENLREELSTRTTGDITLTARWKDNTQPKCMWSSLPTLQTNGIGTATLTCTDEQTGVVSKTLTASDFTTGANGQVIDVSAPCAVTNGYTYTVTLKGLSVGTFVTTLKANTISDNEGNKNDATTCSNITVNGLTYTANFTAGDNAAFTGSTALSCTTTGSNTSCSITLPTITPATGYSEDGWYLGTTKVGSSGDSYTLSGNVTLTTKSTINSYTVTCEDYFVDSSNNLKVHLGTAGTNTYTYGETAKGSDWGSDTTANTYYSYYQYSGSSSTTVTEATTVYRYFKAYNDINMFKPNSYIQGAASFSVSYDGGLTWETNQTNEKDYYLYWGTNIIIKDISPYYDYYELNSVSGVIYDSTNNWYYHTVTSADKKLNFYFKLKDYSVTYNYSENGGSSSTKTTDTVAYGSSIDLTPTATKSGWTFVGWNTDKDATTGLSTLTMSNANVTLYAIYRKEAVTYTATYQTGTNVDSIGKTTDSCTIDAVYNNATQATSCTVTSPSINASTGYSADGWYSGDTKVVNASTSYSLSSNVVLIAKATANTYTITFDENINYFNQTNNTLTNFNNSENYVLTFGEAYISDIQLNDTLVFEANISYKDLTADESQDYFFNIQTYGDVTNWSSAAYDVSFDHYLGTGTAKVTWIWTFKNPDIKKNNRYIFHLRSDHYTGGEITLSNVKITKNNTTKEVSYGSIYGTLPTPTRDGYTFAGWYTDPVGGNKISSTTAVPASDTTYYAHWTINSYDITYDFNNLNNVSLWNSHFPERMTTSYNNNVSSVSITGYVGWEHYYIPINVESGKNYNLSFYAEGTNITPVSSQYSGVGVQILSSIPASGDNDSIDRQIAISYISNGFSGTKTISFTPTTDTVYLLINMGMLADYQTSTFKIGNFKLTESKPYSSTLSTLPTPSSDGFTFNGWYSSASGGSKVSTSTTVPSSNTTYYGQITPVTKTVTYNYSENGGTSSTKTTDTVTYGDSIDFTPTATKSGWTFVGWNTDSTATTGLSSLKMGASNVTLYAIYKKTDTANFTVVDSNAATASSSTASCTIYNNQSSCSVTAPTLTAKTGYNVVGWGTTNGATTTTSTFTSGNTYYSVTYQNLTATFTKGDNVSSIGSTGLSCAAYNGGSCSVTLPSITANDNAEVLGWYNGDTKVGNANSSYTLTSNITLTAKAKKYTASDLNYDNTKGYSTNNCTDVQCALEEINGMLN